MTLYHNACRNTYVFIGSVLEIGGLVRVLVPCTCMYLIIVYVFLGTRDLLYLSSSFQIVVVT